MSIPSSGQVAISDLYTELNEGGKGGNYSLARLSKGDWDSKTSLLTGYTGIDQNSSSKPNRVAQHAISEFYSYNHSQNGSCSGTSFGDALTDFEDIRRSYHRINVTGTTGDVVVITVSCPASSGPSYGPWNNAYYYIFNTYPFDTSGTLLVTSALYSGITTPISSRTDTWYYNLTSTSDIIHIVTYNDLAAIA